MIYTPHHFTWSMRIDMGFCKKHMTSIFSSYKKTSQLSVASPQLNQLSLKDCGRQVKCQLLSCSTTQALGSPGWGGRDFHLDLGGWVRKKGGICGKTYFGNWTLYTFILKWAIYTFMEFIEFMQWEWCPFKKSWQPFKNLWTSNFFMDRKDY